VRRIEKGAEPQALTQWKRANPNRRYSDLAGNLQVKDSIRDACVAEQYGLCAYCCQRISADRDSSHNEHVEAQALALNRTLDFSNIVASCNTGRQCGDAHGSQVLPLTPLMDECAGELKFELSGKVEGLSERARASIEVLKLGSDHQNNRRLIDYRKSMIDTLLFTEGLQPGELMNEDDDILDAMLDALQQLDPEQKMQPFAPVLTNIIRHLRA